MLILSVCMHLKSKVWHTGKNVHTVATFLITKDLSSEWRETGCRPVISLADLEDKEFSRGTGPYSGHGCGTFPQPQGDPTGWDSVSSDIDVMWKKLSPLSDTTKLITVSLCVYSCVSFQSIKVLLQRWGPFDPGWGFCFYSLSLLFWLCFCWQAFAEVWETCVYAAQSVRGSVCRAPAVQSVEIHERKHLSR